MRISDWSSDVCSSDLSLRGPEHSAAWCDEIAKWPQGEAAWDNLMLTKRIGDRPRVVATTTPRGVPLVRRLMGEKGVEPTGGSTRNNRHNLSPQRSEEHPSELQSLMRISSAGFCWNNELASNT